MPQLVLVGNPKARRKARKSHGRSAAQKAATRKLLAANRARRGHSRSRAAVKVVHVSAPAKRRSSRRRSAVKSFTRRVKRSFRRNPIGMPMSLKGAIETFKNGAVGGAGAVGVDIAMGQVVRFMPDTMKANFGAKFNPESGDLNWGYYGVKVALALGLGMAGTKFLPASLRQYAARATDGSLAVMTADLIRLKLPPNLVTLGYVSPAPLLPGNAQPMQGNVRQMPVRRLAGAGMGRTAGAGSMATATAVLR